MDRQQRRRDISLMLVSVGVSFALTRRGIAVWRKDTDLVSTSTVLRSNCDGSKSSNCRLNRKSPSRSLLQSAVAPCVRHRKSRLLSLVPEMAAILAICCPAYSNTSFLSRSQREATARCSRRTSSFEESRGRYCKVARTNRGSIAVTPSVGRGQELRWNTDRESSYSMWETRDCLCREI